MKSLTALLIAIILSSVPSIARNKWQQCGADVNFGATFADAMGSGNSGFCCSIDLTIYNVYVDFGFQPLKHSSDVKINTWNDNRSYMGHLGYRIPINRFYVTPIFGFILTQYGETDGHDWSVSTNGIKNKFHPHEQNTAFDAGLKCGYHAWNSSSVTLDFCLSATNHIVMAGIGLSF